MAAQAVEVANLMEGASLAWAKQVERLQVEMSEFAFVAVNRLLADALSDPQVALGAVRRVLKECNAWQSLTVELHPQDLRWLREGLKGDALTADKSVIFAGSEDVAVGGCRIVSEQGEVDARLEVQLGRLRQSLDEFRAAIQVS
ncbi:FliH/SctL family protein [Paucibacter sp. KBW04]|uniref:FliH/SctL family protein n=1 Tax=Paucibacter sp. KBW04 TaxID=2153361 RepID=UPI000F56927E|nr:FliH/SctL family protein [Paucibacter sp. KBW04]